VRILIVEDDHKLAGFLSRVLVEEGYVVDCCLRGQEAVKATLNGAYDLLLLDWMLPDLPGPDVCRHLRREGSQVPIVMVSARGQARDRALALDAGCNDYLVKPFDVDDLLARIQSALHRTS
jgi:DNA-binding response OmpR family regulator